MTLHRLYHRIYFIYFVYTICGAILNYFGLCKSKLEEILAVWNPFDVPMLILNPIMTKQNEIMLWN